MLMVDLPYACFWLEANGDGEVVKAPPIARWTIGKRITHVFRYYDGKGARLEWL